MGKKPANNKFKQQTIKTNPKVASRHQPVTPWSVPARKSPEKPVKTTESTQSSASGVSDDKKPPAKATSPKSSEVAHLTIAEKTQLKAASKEEKKSEGKKQSESGSSSSIVANNSSFGKSSTVGKAKRKESTDSSSIMSETTVLHRNGEANNEDQNQPTHGWTPFPGTKTKARLKLIVNVPASTAPVKELHKTLSNVVTVLKRADKNFVMAPFRGDNTPRGDIQKEQISTAQQLPKDVNGLKKYFNGAYHKNTGAKLYLDIYIGYNEPFTNLRQIAKLNDFTLEKKNIQAENESKAGWIAFSTTYTSKEELAPAMQKSIEQYWAAEGEEQKCPLELRWGNVTAYNKEVTPTKAMWVIVPTHQLSSTMKALTAIYQLDKEPSEYPLGMSGVFVPDLEHLNVAENKIKAKVFADQQTKWTKPQTGAVNLYDKDLLDANTKIVGLNNHNIREMVMDLKSKDGYPLFHSLFSSFSGEGYNVTMRRGVKGEATSAYKGILPYLLAENTRTEDISRIKKCFSLELVERLSCSRWDYVEQCCISEQDKAMQQMMPEASHYFFDMELVEKGEKSKKLISQAAAMGLGSEQSINGISHEESQDYREKDKEDDKSAESGNGNASNEVQEEIEERKRKEPSPSISPRNGPSDALSTTTDITMDSRIQGLETQMAGVVELMQQMMQQFVATQSQTDSSTTGPSKKQKTQTDAAKLQQPTNNNNNDDNTEDQSRAGIGTSQSQNDMEVEETTHQTSVEAAQTASPSQQTHAGCPAPGGAVL